VSSPFVYELASVQAAVTRSHPDRPTDPYAIPWYMVLGDPGSGRSTAIRSMLLTWPSGSDGMLPLNIPQQLCTYWLANEALFIEPEATVLGPSRDPQRLRDLATELKVSRPREPVDGIILISNIAEFIDLDEKGLEAYGLRLRSYLVEVANAVGADVPVYMVLTRYDTLWGFAEVFQWTPERRREDPWGFNLPTDTPIEKGLEQINKELDGLSARVEAFCLAKLSSEDPPEQRTRAFQHLAELHALMDKLRYLFKALAGMNAFERTPWFRAVGIGSAVPGTGDRLRAGVSRFTNMGLTQGPPGQGGSPRPGGLPIFHFMKVGVLPERDLVPLRTRWRDDKIILICGIGGLALLLIAGVAGIIFKALEM
jgi:type VI protein secretion system component VasK